MSKIRFDAFFTTSTSLLFRFNRKAETILQSLIQVDVAFLPVRKGRLKVERHKETMIQINDLVALLLWAITMGTIPLLFM